eukprot:15164322-Alexandrium_andersonii.AAC.1
MVQGQSAYDIRWPQLLPPSWLSGLMDAMQQFNTLPPARSFAHGPTQRTRTHTRTDDLKLLKNTE